MDKEMPAYSIKVLNIFKSFHGRKVLDNISFSLGPGSLNAIVGENGSGKSTLLKIIVGELKANRGQVQTMGTIGYCPQEPRVFSILTIRENLNYFAMAYGLLKRKGNDQDIFSVDVLINRLGFASYLDQRVNRLSGGTLQKLNLSISLMHNPDILILDEPYGGFDWETYIHFWDLINELKQSGKCILLITHLLNDLILFDKVITLKNGNLQ